MREQQSGLGQPVTKRKSLAPGRGDSYQQPAANPHRAGHYAGLHPEDQPFLTDGEADGGYDDVWPARMPTSARRYQSIPHAPTQHGRVVHHYHQQPLRASRQEYQQLPPQRHIYTEPEAEQPPAKPRRRLHWLLIFGVGMLAMLALWTGFSLLGSWWQIHQDDSTYGRPRTFQIDAVVGHADSASNPSHFIAINLNRRVVIIELPGGDSAKAKIYSVTTLFGDGQDLTPVTLSFKDVNGDGLPDMEIHLQDQTIALLNDNGGFRPPRQGEHVHV